MARRWPPPSRQLAQLGCALLAAALATALSVDSSAAQRIHEPPDASAERRAAGERPSDRVAPRAELTARRAVRRGRRSASSSGPSGGRRGGDPFASMGGQSPFCRRSGLGRRERASCRASGALAHPQPIDHYGWDTHIDTGLDNIAGNGVALLQTVAGLLWLGLLYLVKGVTLALEWAFSLDLLNEAMAGVKRALLRLHRSVFGEAWFLAAIGAVGLWGSGAASSSARRSRRSPGSRPPSRAWSSRW